MNREDWKKIGGGVVEWFKTHPTAAAVIGGVVVGFIAGAIIF